MRYKMELEKRESAGLWSAWASSDAGRDHLGASAASKHWAERSQLSDHHHLHHHVGSELAGARRWPSRCSPHGAQPHAFKLGKARVETGVSGDGAESTNPSTPEADGKVAGSLVRLLHFHLKPSLQPDFNFPQLTPFVSSLLNSCAKVGAINVIPSAEPPQVAKAAQAWDQQPAPALEQSSRTLLSRLSSSFSPPQTYPQTTVPARHTHAHNCIRYPHTRLHHRPPAPETPVLHLPLCQFGNSLNVHRAPLRENNK